MIEQCLSFFYFIEIGLGVNLSVNVKRNFNGLNLRARLVNFTEVEVSVLWGPPHPQ